MKLKMAYILSEETNNFNYLLSILQIINKQNNFTTKEIYDINKNIINKDLIKNKHEFFEGKTISQFQKDTINGFIELIEKGSSNGNKLAIKKQHQLISFLNDYIKQVQELKNNKTINYLEQFFY